MHLLLSILPFCWPVMAVPKPAQAPLVVPSPALPLAWQVPPWGWQPPWLPFSSPTYLNGYLLVLWRQSVKLKVLLCLHLLSLYPRFASFLVTFTFRPFGSVTSSSLVTLPPLTWPFQPHGSHTLDKTRYPISEITGTTYYSPTTTSSSAGIVRPLTPTFFHKTLVFMSFELSFTILFHNDPSLACPIPLFPFLCDIHQVNLQLDLNLVASLNPAHVPRTP